MKIADVRNREDLTREGRRLWEEHHRAFLGVALVPQTYLNIAYLVAACPVGLIYFAILSIGLCVGLALLPILLGIPVLLFTLVGAWKLGGFERDLTRFFLGVEIPPPIRPAVSHRSPRERVETLLRDQVTWTNLLYLLVKLPVGIFTMTAVLAGGGIAIQIAIDALGSVFHGLFSGLPFFFFGAFWHFFWAGFVVLLILHALNGLAYGCARFARVMLGPSEAAIRLAASQAETAHERAKAEKAERSRQELIVNVSHELRTPTASIRGHAESLLMALDAGNANGHGGPDAAPLAAPVQGQLDHLRTYLGIIHRESIRLGDLVDDLLVLARSEADELRLELAPVDAAEVVREVHETLAPLAWRERSVTLILEAPAGLPPVQADRARLVQVLLNLVRNAITHTPPGGIVSLLVEGDSEAKGWAQGAEATNEWVTLVVADTGSGIPPEELERVFERFYRVDASRARTSGGFGLGLAIVRDLVTAMGGTVSVESTVGEGSAFRVVLPVAAPAAEPTFDQPTELILPQGDLLGPEPVPIRGREGARLLTPDA
jgi:signal transduction histidine kinase